MGLPEVLLIIGGLAALAVFVMLWRRFPRKRLHLVSASVLGAGAAVFAIWWVMFRIDDPQFEGDRDRAVDTQKALDDALGKDF
jgi:uncharacterized membrane protein YGL010W